MRSRCSWPAVGRCPALLPAAATAHARDQDLFARRPAVVRARPAGPRQGRRVRALGQPHAAHGTRRPGRRLGVPLLRGAAPNGRSSTSIPPWTWSPIASWTPGARAGRPQTNTGVPCNAPWASPAWAARRWTTRKLPDQKLFTARWARSRSRIRRVLTLRHRPGLGRTRPPRRDRYQQDLVNADCVIIMGSNMAEAYPVGFQWVMKAKARGARSSTLIRGSPRPARWPIGASPCGPAPTSPSSAA
jgi:hypothetical protein